VLAAVGIIIGGASWASAHQAKRNGGVTPAAAGGPTDALAQKKKQQLQREIDEGKQAAREHPRTKPTTTGLRPADQRRAAPATTPSPGIYARRQPMFSASQFATTNFYQGPARGTWMMVWAGSITDPGGRPMDRGAVRVYSADLSTDSAPTFVNVYTVPGSGLRTVHVASCHGTRLTLADEAGRTAVFDLSTLSYI
jgi:hypothetical protein